MCWQVQGNQTCWEPGKWHPDVIAYLTMIMSYFIYIMGSMHVEQGNMFMNIQLQKYKTLDNQKIKKNQKQWHGQKHSMDLVQMYHIMHNSKNIIYWCEWDLGTNIGQIPNIKRHQNVQYSIANAGCVLRRHPQHLFLCSICTLHSIHEELLYAIFRVNIMQKDLA